VTDVDFKEKWQTRAERNLCFFLILIAAFPSDFWIPAPGFLLNGYNRRFLPYLFCRCSLGLGFGSRFLSSAMFPAMRIGGSGDRDQNQVKHQYDPARETGLSSTGR